MFSVRRISTKVASHFDLNSFFRIISMPSYSSCSNVIIIGSKRVNSISEGSKRCSLKIKSITSLHALISLNSLIFAPFLASIMSVYVITFSYFNKLKRLSLASVLPIRYSWRNTILRCLLMNSNTLKRSITFFLVQILLFTAFEYLFVMFKFLACVHVQICDEFGWKLDLILWRRVDMLCHCSQCLCKVELVEVLGQSWLILLVLLVHENLLGKNVEINLSFLFFYNSLSNPYV